MWLLLHSRTISGSASAPLSHSRTPDDYLTTFPAYREREVAASDGCNSTLTARAMRRRDGAGKGRAREPMCRNSNKERQESARCSCQKWQRVTPAHNQQNSKGGILVFKKHQSAIALLAFSMPGHINRGGGSLHLKAREFAFECLVFFGFCIYKNFTSRGAAAK
jgi:hypothetical protein